MGGKGSGNWYRWDKKTKLDEGLTLNINKLVRDGFIQPRGRTDGTLEWTYARTKEYYANIGYEVNTENQDNMWMRVYYSTTIRGEKHYMDYKISITTTKPHYGGRRFWFICPHTAARAAVLYCPPGSRWFASRKACNLKYFSQSESPDRRAISRMWKLKKKLGGENFPLRPKGMHRKTYDRLFDAVIQAEEVCDMHFIRRFGSMTGFKP
jgi:hypothetical protein